MTQHSHHHNERGIALLITLLLMSVLLTVSASLLNITLKQYQFSSIGVASEQAFQAANAGLECILWHDYEAYPDSKFDVDVPDPNVTIACMGSGNTDTPAVTSGSGYVRRDYRFSWGTDPEVCSDVTLYKFESASGDVDMSEATGKAGQVCAEKVVCTVIRARGYNVACPSGSNPFPPRTIEREITQRY
jgi:hypothetical protein